MSPLSALLVFAAICMRGPGDVPVPTALIPREVLFGNPQRSAVRIAPDGSMIGFLAPRDGVLNVWTQPLEGGSLVGQPTPRTALRDRPVRQWEFVPGGRQLVYLQDRGGDENFQMFAVDLADSASNEERCLTPWPGTRTRIIEIGATHPNEVLVGVNRRDPRYHDVWRVNVKDGSSSLVMQNDEGWSAVIPDGDWQIRLVTRVRDDGATEVMMRTAPSEPWVPFHTWQFEDSTSSSVVAIDSDGTKAYVIDSARPEGGATGGIYEVTLVPHDTDQRWRILAADDRAEPGTVLRHALTGIPQAISFNYLRNEWRALDLSYEQDFRVIRKAESGDIDVVSRTTDDRLWILATSRDTQPTRFSLYRREDRSITPLFSADDRLANLPLVPMRSEIIRSRDDLPLVTYWSAPTGFELGSSKPVPMVLLVHGGPWTRDVWGLSPTHQWLANRGYAVMSVNYRSSTGFGKAFVNAGNRQWSKAMHDDLVDAVRWAIDQRLADPNRVAIMGTSYGGYATLVGLTFTPELFACGVDIVGPSHVRTLLSTIPPYWTPHQALYARRVGDLSETEFLDSISPLTKVERIVRPLLVGQGANDPRVRRVEADQIVTAMQSHGIPVTYILFPDEGHGFARPENRMAFFAITEQFLAKHLGGRAEPIGDDVRRSTALPQAGGELIPGLDQSFAR